MSKKLSEKELVDVVSRLEKFANLTDAKYKVPMTNIRFGIDSIIGLIPIVGELAGVIMSLYLLSEARKVKAPLSLKLKMIGNMGIDFGIGLIPIVGDLADVGFKSNIRNVKLLVEHIDSEYRACRDQVEKEMVGSGKIIFAGIVMVVLGLCFGVYNGLI